MTVTTATGVFDTEHPPSGDLVSDCVHCGFCLPVCPTYVLWQKEMDSPRGRIHLMRLGLEGEIELSDGFVRHIEYMPWVHGVCHSVSVRRAV